MNTNSNVFKVFILLNILIISFTNFAQAQVLKDGKFKLNEDGSHFMKFTLLNQVWLRSQNYNPGTTIFGYAKNNGTDIGIRRFRVQFFGQLTDRVFVYSQFGENNFNNIADRKAGFFVHDAIGEYAVVKNKLSLGGGLTAWGGLSRFSSPSVGTILGVDAPLFLQSTNDVTDQFLRHLAIYAKGKLGKFDYRFTMTEPMAFQKSNVYSGVLKTTSNFSSYPTKMQWNGYVHYEFLDQESNQTPYMAGSYLGKKKVFTIGAGFVAQPKAMWHLADNQKDTVQTNMVQLSMDAFYDAPIGKDGQAISAYLNYTNFDFGPNYIRNLGAMNPTTGTTNTTLLNGSGNNFPMYGTGDVLYAQVGYKFKDNLIGKTTIMPYASIQHANYKRLKAPMNFIDVGVNFLLSGQTSKLTVAYQNRPLFTTDGSLTGHRGGGIIQYQVYFN
jgi:hypothetical protein